MRNTRDKVKHRSHVLESLMFSSSPAQSAKSASFDNSYRQENMIHKECELLINSYEKGEQVMHYSFNDEDLVKKEFKPVDPGEYEAVVQNVKVKNNQIMLRFRSTEDGTFLCNDFIHFTDKGRPSAFRKLIILGLKKDDSGKLVVDDTGYNLIGLSAVLTLVHAKNPNYMMPDFNAKNHGYQPIRVKP